MDVYYHDDDVDELHHLAHCTSQSFSFSMLLLT